MALITTQQFVLSVRQGCMQRLRKMEDIRDIDFVTFEIWVLVLAALLLALMTIEWIFVWCITLLNDQRHEAIIE